MTRPRWTRPEGGRRRPGGRPPLSRLAGEDRGAVAAIVAVVLGMGVLLGMGTLIVDVGRLYVEREELQSGADAAAWAVAEGCVRLPDTCADQLAAAQEYAGENAKDEHSGVTAICGRGPGLAEVPVDGCPSTGNRRSDCHGSAPTVNYAEVHTRTLLPNGSTLLPPTFAGALADGYDGTDVTACARVAWGPPRSATALAMTFSTCEFNRLTDNGTVFWPSPAEDPSPDPAAERMVLLTGERDSACPGGPPGAFGWLDDPTESCTTTVDVDGSFGGEPGNRRAAPECEATFTDLWTNPKAALIPIYEETAGSGQNATYDLAGFASFVVTGYRLTSLTRSSWLTGRTACRPGTPGNSDRCLFGYFTRGLVPTSGAEIGGEDLGVAVLNLVG
ncbi:MAG TPA: pilus assembly protein TadG-related protein [Catenuloplanes sp.]